MVGASFLLIYCQHTFTDSIAMDANEFASLFVGFLREKPKVHARYLEVKLKSEKELCQ